MGRQNVIARLIQEFDFSDYGLDYVLEADPEWIEDLAQCIDEGLGI